MFNLDQHDDLLQNINEIIPRIIYPLLDNLSPKRDTTPGEIDGTLLKIVMDIYSQLHKKEELCYPNMYNMMKILIDENKNVKDLARNTI